MELSTTLLREKFVIRDGKGEDLKGHPLVAVSNRLVLPLLDGEGKPSEIYVIRSHTMHTCIRMAAKIVQTYLRSGPLSNRGEKFDFADAWEDIIEEYERQFNPERWVCVYKNGKIVYAGGEHHTFLDMIEKCDSRNPGNYDEAVFLAEESFAAVGKRVIIDHNSNTGMVATIGTGSGKVGLILRNPNRRTTFNFTAMDKDGGKVTAAQCLIVAAAYLEGIQIAFQIGITNEKIRTGVTAKYSDEDRRSESGRKRLGRLSAEISAFENSLKVRYRPEKPEFVQIILDAEQHTHEQMVARPPERAPEPPPEEKQPE